MSNDAEVAQEKSSSDTLSQTSTDTASEQQQVPPEELEPLEDLWTTWGQLVSDWENQYKKRAPFIKELVRKGIPQQFRSIVWQLLCGAESSSLRNDYVKYLRQSSPCEKVIRRDIARTFPEHDFFKEKDGPGQERLFNVMKAYSLYDSEVGYCQGSAFLVGVLLLQMPEEDAFAVFVKLMQDYRLREMYKPTMAELGLCIYQLECMVEELLPELYMHFKSQNYHTSMYASSWFLTLFTSCLPLHLANRAIDLFLSEGMEMIFRLAIAILIICKEDLLRLDMENLLKYFQKEMPAMIETDPDYLVTKALQVKYDAKKMKKLCKDYNTLKAKEQEEMVELRRLRTENRLLRQRIEMLEQESAELADKLIQGQVSRAQEAEDAYVLKRELAAIKALEMQSRSELADAYKKIEELQEQLAEKRAVHVKEAQMLIESLQEELVAVKLREAENSDEMKHMFDRIDKLEEQNQRLRDLPPDHAVAQLQEELISVKLREAEANLSMKELRQKIADLQSMWQEHLSTAHPIVGSGMHNNGNGDGVSSSGVSQPNSLENHSRDTSLDSSLKNQGNNNPDTSRLSAPSGISSVTASPLKMVGNALKRVQNGCSSEQQQEINRLKQELLSAKLREAEAVSELKELRQRVMELETQNQVSLNQIRRQAEEVEKLKQEIEAKNDREKELQAMLKEEQRKSADIDFKIKEEQMMRRIQDIEKTQMIAELKQKISALEAKNEELVAIKKLTDIGSEPKDAKEFHNKMAELQSEMFRLDACQQKLNTLNYMNGKYSFLSNASPSNIPGIPGMIDPVTPMTPTVPTISSSLLNSISTAESSTITSTTANTINANHNHVDHNHEAQNPSHNHDSNSQSKQSLPEVDQQLSA